jgi:hypothetical protein
LILVGVFLHGKIPNQANFSKCSIQNIIEFPRQVFPFKKNKSTQLLRFCDVYMATKAAHLGLVSELTTKAFLAGIMRFISRRRLCVTSYSDNATNFVGTKNEMEDRPFSELKNTQQLLEIFFICKACNTIEIYFCSCRDVYWRPQLVTRYCWSRCRRLSRCRRFRRWSRWSRFRRGVTFALTISTGVISLYRHGNTLVPLQCQLSIG